MQITKIRRYDKTLGHVEHRPVFYKANKPDARIDVKLELNSVGDDDGYSYAKTYMIVKSDVRIKLRALKKWAYENLEQRCSCEHDCCGHWFTTSIGVKKLKNRTFAIQIGYAQNY